MSGMCLVFTLRNGLKRCKESTDYYDAPGLRKPYSIPIKKKHAGKGQMKMELGDNASFFLERRGKPRTDCNYPAVIKGRDAEGKKVETKAQVVNLSASGMFLHLDRLIPEGETVAITVEFQIAAVAEMSSRLTAQSFVVRSGPDGAGGYGLAVKINRFRFH